MTGILDGYRTQRVDSLLSQQLLSTVIDGSGTYEKLIANDRSFIWVQKFIFAARCSVFAVLTIIKVVGDHNDMDCTFTELNQFVKFMYTGELEGLVNHGLMQLAITYQIKNLEVWKTFLTSI